jgi:hypothetical protein
MRKEKQITVPNIGDTITLNCGYGGGPDETLCRIKSIYHSLKLFGDGYNLSARVSILGTGEEFTTDLI